MKFSQTYVFVMGLFLYSCADRQTKNQPPECEDFKNGTFENFVDTIRIVTERKDGFQIEKTEMGDSKYKVTWNSDCEYELELIETNIDFTKKYIGRKYQVKIIQTQENQYTYECRIEGIDFVDKGTLKRIK